MVKQHPNTNLLDFEKAKMNGQVLTSLDEARLRNTQLRAARKMYLNTMTLSEREPLFGWGRKFIKVENDTEFEGFFHILQIGDMT